MDRKPRRKRRGDAKLWSLEPAMQEAIIARLETGTIEQTLKWIADECGITSSAGALSEWRSSWLLDKDMNLLAQQTDDFMESLRQLKRFTAEEITEEGQKFYLKRGLVQQDPELFAAMAYLKLKRDTAKFKGEIEKEKLSQGNRRLALLEKKAEQADQAKQAMGNEKLTMEQKHARLKEVFGMA